MQTLVTRRALTIGPLVIAVAFVVATIAQAQVERVADPNWTAPRTADGHPDLQGMWGQQDDDADGATGLTRRSSVFVSRRNGRNGVTAGREPGAGECTERDPG